MRKMNGHLVNTVRHTYTQTDRESERQKRRDTEKEVSEAYMDKAQSSETSLLTSFVEKVDGKLEDATHTTCWSP